MEEWQIELISKNLPRLIELTNCNIRLLTRFESCLILGRDDIEKLNVAGLTRSQQTREFYNIIVKSKNSFETLLNALEETCQSGALAILNVESYFDDTQISYDKYSELGQGSYGTIVYKGEIGDRVVAVKMVHFNFLGRVQVLHEIKMLKDCDAQENVVRYFGAKRIGTSILIALELCDLSLKDWVENKYNDIPPVEVLRQMTVGLGWLHSRKIVHRDIKPENVLFIQQTKKVKLSDFGLSRRILDGNSFVATTNVGGTPGWLAPEILIHREQESQTQCKFTYASDVFSLGCVYYYVLSDGKLAFGNPIRCQGNILDGKSMITAKGIQHGCSQNILLINLMILHDPKSRPTCNTILSYPLFWSTNDRVRFLDKLVTQIGSGMEKISSHKSQDPCRFDHSTEIRALRDLDHTANQWIGCVLPFAYTQHTSEKVHSFEVKAENCETLESTTQHEIASGSVNNIAQRFNKPKTEQIAIIAPSLHSGADNPNQSQSRIVALLKELKQLNLEEKTARIFEIVWKKDLSIIKGVLEGIASQLEIIDVWDEKQKSLLHVAVARGDYDVVEHLVNNHMFEKVLSESRFEHTLVHTCINTIHKIDAEAFTQKCRILELLFKKRPQLTESREDYQHTPLHVETKLEFRNGKQVELIGMLLRHNANVNAKDKDENTPHHLLFRNEALPGNAVEIIRLFITNNAHPEALNSVGQRFLDIAAKHAYPSLFHEVVLYLVSIHKTNSFTIAGSLDYTVLHEAVREMNGDPLSETLEIFKAHRVDFNALDIFDDSVMFAAIEGGRSEDFLRLLMHLGADWTIKNKFQHTALHIAAFSQNLPALKLFISLGSNVNAKNKDGDTPLHTPFLRYDGINHDIVNELVDNGADPTLKNKEGKSPLDLAKEGLKREEVEQRTVQLLQNASKTSSWWKKLF